MKKHSNLRVVLITSLLLLTLSCNSQPKPANSTKPTENKDIKYKVTFIELGSVRCIPCQQMQPVMKSISEKYPTQVNVVFHDVWTEAGSPYGKKFGIEAIPTQK